MLQFRRKPFSLKDALFWAKFSAESSLSDDGVFNMKIVVSLVVAVVLII